MSEGAGIDLLTTLGEAGGLAGIVGALIAVVIRLIKRNGCTCKLYNCSGQPLAEVDCEKGAPTKRFFGKDSDASDKGTSLSEVTTTSKAETA